MIVNRYKNRGYTQCRRADDTADNLKVDVIGTGILNIQAKRTEQKPQYEAILLEMLGMKSKEKVSFYEQAAVNVIFHKRSRQPELAVMLVEEVMRMQAFIEKHKVEWIQFCEDYPYKDKL
ncbi:MAG: hypothetical protein MK076_03275 [Flavobacteriales bacterium]|nr:hypothetical protein [Flavobacteriales bacterium]